MIAQELDNNIKSFSLPIKVKDNEEYRKRLEEELKKYVISLKHPAFISEEGLFEEVKNNCELILQILDELIAKRNEEADEKIEKMLNKFVDNPFFVSTLSESYSFRQSASFTDQQIPGYGREYSKMLNTKLTFYRVRTKKKETSTNISEVKDILHLPYDLRKYAGNMRFSSPGLPGLYLGVNTYTCSKECRWDKETEELYASVFIPNEKGEKYRILNLTIPSCLINGIYRKADPNDEEKKPLWLSMLKIFPLVIAISFSVEKDEEFKYHYLLSQSLMRVANKCGIDGIAYLSMQGKDDFQFPQGVNLAIPATDISENRRYSEKCKGFEISKPVKYQGQEEKSAQSYINKIYKKYDRWGIEEYMSKLEVDGKEQFYGETIYGKFDNYLVLHMQSMYKAELP
ncbi:hypothetical protein DXC28_15655 [Ruminococcus sp. OM08-9BH]|nr:hypothetical protein DXC28_15655 [Ruminococcus sp. OM08-9BH]